MSFWQLDAPAAAPALIAADSESCCDYASLAKSADDFCALLGTRTYKRLGFVLCRNDLASITAYLGALRGGDCVALLPERLGREQLEALITRYRPDWLLAPKDNTVAISSNDVQVSWLTKTLNIAPTKPRDIYPDTALLLSTSGSTGSPKMVRLSYTNLAANAESIASYLKIDNSERAITSLPIHYSFGLSIINSHLARGAAVVLSDDAVTGKAFWEIFKSAGVTSLAGVPAMWQMLQRLRLERMDLPSLRTLTQAGGRLTPELIRHFAQVCRDKAWRLFVMYGQTEAAPRIAYVPWERLTDKIGAIGLAIPGGRLSLGDGDELIYHGPNVMLGYAECAADLAKGDECGGVLHTGDLARVDEEGYYWLTGRSKRIAKLFGNRINLDEIEALLESSLKTSVAALDDDDRLQVFIAAGDNADQLQAQALEILREHLQVHPSGLLTHCLPALPLTASGKKDYPGLRALFTRI